MVTVLDAVDHAGIFASTEEAKVYLAQLAETVPAISNVEQYARIVQEQYRMRQLIQVGQSLIRQAEEGANPDLALESAEQKLYELRSGRDSSELSHIGSSILDIYNTLQNLSGEDREKYMGIPTGFSYLDTKLTGLGRSDLIILAARPGMGKTSFALNIATNVAKKQKIPVAIFSLEMSKEQLFQPYFVGGGRHPAAWPSAPASSPARSGTIWPPLPTSCSRHLFIWTTPPPSPFPR